MAPTATEAPVKLAPFPAAEIEASLRKELLQAAESIAQLSGEVLPAGKAQQSSMSVQLDSLLVVNIVLTVEPIMGFPVKEHVVKAGGYSSVDDALGDLLPKLEKEWTKHNNKGGKK
jgi:hypothetical protein